MIDAKIGESTVDDSVDVHQQFDDLDMADIEELDLSMIKIKLRDVEDGPGWSVKRCEEAEVEYKRFLSLKKLYPDKDIGICLPTVAHPSTTAMFGAGRDAVRISAKTWRGSKDF